MGVKHPTRRQPLYTPHPRRRHESERGVREDENRSVGAVQHVRPSQQRDWIECMCVIELIVIR